MWRCVNKRTRIFAIGVLTAFVTSPVAAVLYVHTDSQIKYIQVVGFVPGCYDPEHSDECEALPQDQGKIPNNTDATLGDDNGNPLDITADHFDVQTECFDNWRDPTVSYKLIANETWGEDVRRVVIGGFEAEDFGFDVNHEWTTDGATLSCQDFAPQWQQYSVPEFGFLLVSGTLNIVWGDGDEDGGDTGTEVVLDKGFRLYFTDSSTLNVTGIEGKPVVFKGSQWPGLVVAGEANFQYCEFSQASGQNGALEIEGSADVEIHNCTFENNKAEKFGGAIRVLPGAVVAITDSLFKNNSASVGGAIYMDLNGTTINDFENVTFEGNEADLGGALYAIDITNPATPEVLDNVTFMDNVAGRGGALFVDGAMLDLSDGVIVGNTARVEGGGLGLGVFGGDVTLRNPTIAYNKAKFGGDGGGIHIAAGDVDIHDGILWGNEVMPGGAGPQISNPGGTVFLERVLVEGGVDDGVDGPSTNATIFTGDPSFRKVPDEAGEGEGSAQADFRLASDSTAINQGSVVVTGIGDGDDRAGLAREFGGGANLIAAVDLGAYEFPNNPPVLSTAGDNFTLTVDEGDEPVLLEFCGSYTDDDSHPDFTEEQFPSVTEVPGENLVDAENPEQSAGNPFGRVRAYEAGEPGATLQEDSAIGGPDEPGRAFYDPANRSTTYSVSIECRVKDQLSEMVDGEKQVNDELSMFSRGSQTASITVTADNDPPSFQSGAPAKITAGSDFETDLRFSDADQDHPEVDLDDPYILSGPDWVSLRRTEDDVAVLEGHPPEAGTYEVEVVVTDPDGGTGIKEITLNVEAPAELDPVDAGDDKIAEAGEGVLLSATGPDQNGWTYEWYIEDSTTIEDPDTEIATGFGKNYTWTPPVDEDTDPNSTNDPDDPPNETDGLYTAIVQLKEAGTVIDEDRLAITVETGSDGTVTDVEDRAAPSDQEEQDLDAMAANDAAWESQPVSTKAATLATITGKGLSTAQQDAALDELSSLLENAATPLDPPLAEELAAAYGNLAGLELSPDRRADVLDGIATLRAQAEGIASDDLSAALIQAAGGLSTAREDLSSDERATLLEGLATDLGALAGNGGSLDANSTTVALAAISNTLAGGNPGGAQVEQAIAALNDILDSSTMLSETTLAMGAITAANLLKAGGGALTMAQRDDIKQLARDIAMRSVKLDQPISVTGSDQLKIATAMAPASTGVSVGSPSPAGPQLIVPAVAVDELRTRNAIVAGEDMGIAIVMTLPDEASSHVVEIFAVDGNGNRLTETALTTTVTLTIPRYIPNNTQPVSTSDKPVTISETKVNEKSVSFDTDEFASFTLASSITSEEGSSDSDKSSCFLDSLF